MNRVFVTFASRLDVARYHREVFAHIEWQVGRVSGKTSAQKISKVTKGRALRGCRRMSLSARILVDRRRRAVATNNRLEAFFTLRF
jgi:hypothetical protein